MNYCFQQCHGEGGKHVTACPGLIAACSTIFVTSRWPWFSLFEKFKLKRVFVGSIEIRMRIKSRLSSAIRLKSTLAKSLEIQGKDRITFCTIPNWFAAKVEKDSMMFP